MKTQAEWRQQKILITGGKGFLGSKLIKKLIKKGIPNKNIITFSSSEHDLRKNSQCIKVVKNIDVVIHLAAKVGGIGYNKENPATLFYDNTIMSIQLMEAARLAGVKKFVTIGTICSYPNLTPVPFREDDLWKGYPEKTNAPYGLAKKILLTQSQAYRQQYGFNAIYLMPVNLYGPGDNFDPKQSHVIPALIKKISEAIKNNEDSITVWGDGSASREFLYVEDAAEAIALATEKYNQPEPVNLGSGFEIKIKNLVNLICLLMDYHGKIIWDKSKPNGQPRRKLDVSRAKKEFGFTSKTDFKKGLAKTIRWYQQQAKINRA
jgi:GDP-L-fucose synthase